MPRFAIPAYIYVETATEQEAIDLKIKIEKLLKSPMVDGVIRSQGINHIGINVTDPLPSK